MVPAQVALLGSAVLAFSIFFTGTKIMSKRYGPLPFLTEFDLATNFRDPQVAGAFAIGLVITLMILGGLLKASECCQRMFRVKKAKNTNHLSGHDLTPQVPSPVSTQRNGKGTT